MALVKLINDFINDKFKMDGSTVKKAFIEAAALNLTLDGRRVNPATFGQHLSVNVVGQVLKAYQEFIQAETARPKAYLPKHRTELDTPHDPISPAEAWELVEKWYREDEKFAFIAPYLGAYEHLVLTKKIKPVHNPKKGFGANQSSPQRRAVESYLKLSQ